MSENLELDINQKAKKVVEVLIPRVEKTIKELVSGNIKTQIDSLKQVLQNELWDKAVAEIGKRMNLPADVIKRLQQIDDFVKANKGNVDASIAEMIAKVEGFKDRLKGIDLNKMITMSYGDLQKTKAKSSAAWASISFLLGLFIGLALF